MSTTILVVGDARARDDRVEPFELRLVCVMRAGSTQRAVSAAGSEVRRADATRHRDCRLASWSGPHVPVRPSCPRWVCHHDPLPTWLARVMRLKPYYSPLGV